MTIIPAHARLTRKLTCITNEESRYPNKRFTLKEFTGVASDGYKTDYTAREAKWLQYELEGVALGHYGQMRRVQRLTGKNLKHAETNVDAVRAYAQPGTIEDSADQEPDFFDGRVEYAWIAVCPASPSPECKRCEEQMCDQMVIE